MKKLFFLLVSFALSPSAKAQVSSVYTISFENAVHHEAVIHATFKDLGTDEIEFRMSRSSPGRYALHEFAKNVYKVKVTDSKGKVLVATRPDPYAWKVTGHDGTIKVSYTLFANRCDGTYSQIDESHAHLNMPATFMYVPVLSSNEMEVSVSVRDDLDWKVATQLKHLKDNTFYAKDLQYFMDSPIEISNHSIRSFKVDEQTINFVLHHKGTDAELDTYFEKVKKVVLQQRAVYGELPSFDYDEYTFLACYVPNASGDGMEHRNSTVLSSSQNLIDSAFGGISTVSHEFFHCWNVERIRPKSLDPFNFDSANMSGELWFAEGFTSYYDKLILVRSDLMDEEKYLKTLSKYFNYVWNSSGRQFFNPIEMSYQAPFVDAATSVDPVNRNTFISYYSYGSMLGLALDLSLRGQGLNLDDYMRLVWNTYGKSEKYYTLEDLQETLKTYAGKELADDFFGQYIYKSEMPDYEQLFESVGILMQKENDEVYLGISLEAQKITNYPSFDSPAYNAGLTKGDEIIQIGSYVLSDSLHLKEILELHEPGDSEDFSFERFGELKHTKVTFQSNPNYALSLYEKSNMKLDKKAKKRREDWLKAK